MEIALCEALIIPSSMTADLVPEWIQLLPPGPQIETVDKRGPYRLVDAAQLVRVSLAAAGGRMPIDENHATDLAAPKGGAAPARGWLVALEARSNGVWGRVEWTAEGRRLVADRAYRFISPVVTHSADNTLLAILRASLVNAPNLRGLAALNQVTVPLPPLTAVQADVAQRMGIDPEEMRRTISRHSA